MCQSTILNSKGGTIVSYCPKCQNCFIWQNSFLLSFSSFQFECFAADIAHNRLDKEFVSFPDGSLRTYLETPLQEVLLTFTEEEWSNFGQAIEEAYYLREVLEIINKDSKS